ncbi:DUF3139 domain-containing protein [Paenibacillus sp. CN-4]|uniref:DUF3139 domain-containing protein n=1 Tax=Paenibacillus nanchangensis TaxID=3348343 RepID=UPI00397E0E79
MKKGSWFTLFAAGILVVGYFSVTGLPHKKDEIEQEVKTYLMTEGSYQETDILDIKGVYSLKSTHYEAIVVYKDEPQVNYTYEKMNGSFKLVSTSNLSGKHMDGTFYQ